MVFADDFGLFEYSGLVFHPFFHCHHDCIYENDRSSKFMKPIVSLDIVEGKELKKFNSTPCQTLKTPLVLVLVEWGSMPEWLMGADCKSAGYAYASSNLARPIHNQPM